MLCHVQFLAIPRTAACQSSLSFTSSRSLLKFVSTESMMLSNHFILCCSLLLPSVFPNIQVFSNESAHRIRWPKYWNFSFAISPCNEYSGLISFSIDCSPCCPRESQQSFPALQFESISSFFFESINSLALRIFHGPTLITVHDYWKNHSFDYTDLCWQSDVSTF